jgi:hypothetical protein
MNADMNLAMDVDMDAKTHSHTKDFMTWRSRDLKLGRLIQQQTAQLKVDSSTVQKHAVFDDFGSGKRVDNF